MNVAQNSFEGLSPRRRTKKKHNVWLVYGPAVLAGMLIVLLLAAGILYAMRPHAMAAAYRERSA